MPSRMRKSIKVKDLKMYRDNGGCLYFVVWINTKTKEKIISYKEITPRYAECLLKEKKNRNSITVQFNLFPDNQDNVIKLLENFHYTSAHQNSFIGKHLPTFPEVIESGNQIELFVGKDPLCSILPFRKGFTYVAEHKDNIFVKQDGLVLPVEMTNTEITHISSTEYFRFQDGSFDEQITNTITTDQHRTCQIIGECLIYSFESGDNGNDPKELTFCLRFSPMLSIRISQIKLILAINDPVDLLDPRFHLTVGNDEKRMEYWDNIHIECKRVLPILEKIQNSLLRLGISEDLDLSQIKNDDMQSLNLLLAWYDHQLVNTHSTEDKVVLLRVGNLGIPFFADYKGKGKALFLDIRDDIENLAEPKLAFFIDGKNLTKKNRTSKYAAYLVSNLEEISNFSIEEILKDFSRFEEGVLPNAIYLFDVLLKTFDRTGQDRFLDDAGQLLCWFKQNHNHNDEEFNLLYSLQISIRKRNLTSEEIANIYKVAYSSQSLIYKAFSFLMVKDLSSYDELCSQLSVEDKAYVENSAAYSFFKKRICTQLNS